MYSNPPLYGAKLVATVFNTPSIREQWDKDVKTMATRIIGARQALVQKLAEAGSKRDWKHITNQIGMFAYSGLSESEVQKLRDYNVYMNLDGRMSISGINSGNVAYLADAMHKATNN
jgi:aspartate aminotransferase, mitochondrial